MTVILYLYFIYFIRGGCIGVLFYFEVLIKN